MGVAPAGVLYALASQHLLKTIGRSCGARPGRVNCILAVLACGAHQALYAASATPFAAPEPLASSGSGGGLLRVAAALLVVLGAVIVAARLARRMRGVGGGTSAALEVLGQLPLGTRERAVLIRVGERQLLIGVAAGSVRTLHVFDTPVSSPASSVDAALSSGADAASPNRPSFKALLLRSLGK
jgi:flagellar protein FliO/FliZ